MTSLPPASAPAPTAAALGALPADDWAWLLPHVRAALHELPDSAVTPAVQRLRAAPTGRLAGGRSRRDLARLLAEGGAAWDGLVARLRRIDDPPPSVRALLDDPTASPVVPSPTAARHPPGGGPGSAAGSAAETVELRAKVREGRAKLREGRAERNELRRRLEGALARTEALEAKIADLERALAEAGAATARAEAELAAATDDRRRAVEREQRRRDADIARLEATVSELRRAEEERRAEAKRRSEAQAAAVEASRSAQAEGRRAAQDQGPSRLVPGRPSHLPAGVVEDTTEAVELLLHPGRRVLVDGYNVSKARHPDLDLEGQRTWLVQQLAALAARRRIRPVVIFDGERGSSGRPPAGARTVDVRFTAAGVTADDELVLAVEGTDEPVVVVTDDRELRARVLAAGADVVRSQPFLWALR